MVVLITGSSSGFGRLAAETMARRGWQVFASMRELEGKNEKAAAGLREVEGSLTPVEIDVTHDGSVERGVATVIEAAGRVDVLVNNAGCAQTGIAEAYTVEQYRRIFEANFYGCVRMNRAVLPHMRRAGKGLLVHISSGAGRVVIPFQALYCASKWALEAYAEACRYELKPLGVDSVLVEPGAFPTAIFGKSMPPEDRGRAAEYGAIAKLPERVSGAFQANLEAFAPDSMAVVDAVIRLMEMKPEERPLRTLVGKDVQPIEPLNRMSDELNRRTLDLFGLTELG